MISKNMNKRNNNLLLELKYFEIINIGRNDNQPTPMGLKCLGKGPGGRDMVCADMVILVLIVCVALIVGLVNAVTMDVAPVHGIGVEMVAKLFLFITTINLACNSFQLL